MRFAASSEAIMIAAAPSLTPEAFPAKSAKKARPHRFGIAWWHREADAVWLTRREPKGLLGGMAALPGPEWSDACPSLNPLAIARRRGQQPRYRQVMINIHRIKLFAMGKTGDRLEPAQQGQVLRRKNRCHSLMFDI